MKDQCARCGRPTTHVARYIESKIVEQLCSKDARGVKRVHKKKVVVTPLTYKR